MPFNRLPEVDKCCGCVTDLKAASAIIAVLGIVTCPAVSWAVVRHSYVIRVSCFVTTSASRADVVDINLNNIVSFGFGANAGLRPSCLGPKNATAIMYRILRSEDNPGSTYVTSVKYLGWAVFAADLFLLLCSIRFLYRLYKGPEKNSAIMFMYASAIAVILSFIYGMLYVTACISVGGAFPIFEFVFSIADVFICLMWVYFILVIQSYIRASTANVEQNLLSRILQYPFSAWNTAASFMALLYTYLFGVHYAFKNSSTLFDNLASVDLLSNGG